MSEGMRGISSDLAISRSRRGILLFFSVQFVSQDNDDGGWEAIIRSLLSIMGRSSCGQFGCCGSRWVGEW